MHQGNDNLQAGAAIALDVGGSSVKSAVVMPDGALSCQPVTTPVDNQASAEAIVETFAGIVRRHLRVVAANKIGGIGFAFPGPFDYATGVCRITGVEKFESLFGIDIGVALRARLPGFAAPIRFRNDAEAAIAGEVRYGAGRPYRRVLGVTLGTGIGSAFFEVGLPVLRRSGIPDNGWLYAEPACGARADDVFSIRGLTARLRVAGVMADSVKSAADLAHAGDPAAQTVFARFGADLGAFLQPFVAAFGADAVLTLGGIGNAFDLFGPPLRAQLPVPALPGELGVRAALLGAAELVFQRAQIYGIK